MKMDGREESPVCTTPMTPTVSYPRPTLARFNERLLSKIDPAIWPPPFTGGVQSNFVIENRPIQGVLHQNLPLSKDERAWIRWPLKLLYYPVSLVILPILVVFIVGIIVYYTVPGA